MSNGRDDGVFFFSTSSHLRSISCADLQLSEEEKFSQEEGIFPGRATKEMTRTPADAVCQLTKKENLRSIQKHTPKIEISPEKTQGCDIHSAPQHKHPNKTGLIFIFHYFSIYFFPFPTLCFLSPVIIFLLHLPHIPPSSFFLSHLRSEMLIAESLAWGAARTKAPRTQIQHVYSVHIHIKAADLNKTCYCSDFVSLKRNCPSSENVTDVFVSACVSSLALGVMDQIS